MRYLDHDAVTSLSSSELAILPKFRALLLRELPPRFSRDVVSVLQSRGMMSSEIEGDVTEVCRKTIHAVFNEVLALLQATSPSPDQMHTSEATSSPSLSPPSTSSAQLAPSTFGTAGDPMKSVPDLDSCFRDYFSTSEWQTVGPWSIDTDAGTEMMLNLTESNPPGAMHADSSSCW